MLRFLWVADDWSNANRLITKRSNAKRSNPERPNAKKSTLIDYYIPIENNIYRNIYSILGWIMKIFLETVVSCVLFFEMNFKFYLEVNYGYQICKSSNLCKKLSKGDQKKNFWKKFMRPPNLSRSNAIRSNAEWSNAKRSNAKRSNAIRLKNFYVSLFRFPAILNLPNITYVRVDQVA
jgi:hypothetical protein